MAPLGVLVPFCSSFQRQYLHQSPLGDQRSKMAEIAEKEMVTRHSEPASAVARLERSLFGRWGVLNVAGLSWRAHGLRDLRVFF